MKKTYISFLAFSMLMLLFSGYSTAQITYDDATDADYNDGWTTGDNGGNGFGQWTFNSGNGGGFVATTLGNPDCDILSSGEAFGMWANNGFTIEALRSLSSPLAVGQEIIFFIDNGGIGTGSSLGFNLRNASNEELFAFYFAGGNTNYEVADQSGASATTLGWQNAGLQVFFKLETTSSYTLRVKKLSDHAVVTHTGNLKNPANGQTVSELRFFHYEATGQSSDNFYINHLAVADVPTGDGSSTTPYQIASLGNIYWLSQHAAHWDKDYEQTADIDASTSTLWDGGAGFSPIGNWLTEFTGSYDGQGHTIDGLHSNRPSADEVGFIGHANGATVSNLSVTNAEIHCNSSGGAVVGESGDNSTITNCFASGNISGRYAGGLVGSASTGTEISNCHSTASVSSVGEYVGGLVGSNYNGTITDSYSTGNVSGTSDIGGLVGWSYNGTISNTYSTGIVSGSSDRVGGLVGYNEDGTVTNSYSTGSVSGNTAVGGLVGENVSGTVSNSFFLSTAGPDNSLGTPKSEAELKDVATFTSVATAGLSTAWDFVGDPNDDSAYDDFWNIDATKNNGYPFLRWQYPTIWNGSAWNNGTPASTIDAIIDGEYSEPVNFECANLTLNDNLIILPTREITVNGDIDGAGQIHLQSNTSLFPGYYDYGIGSLIHTTDGRQGSVQRYISGSQWHLVQTPTGGFPVQNIFEGDWVYAYNNTPEWHQLQWGDVFSEDEGYLVWSSDDETKLFEGNLNAGTISFTPPAMGEYALVGNPYPSPIDWNLVNKDQIDNTAYIWDAINNTYQTHNGTTGTGCFLKGIIPATQGFLIYASTASASFELTDDVRRHPSDFSGGKTSSDLVRLYLEAPASTSELLVYAEDAAANGLDELDSKKLFSFVEETSEVYALVGNEPVAINALKSITDNTVVPLGLTVGTNGTHTFNLDASEFEGQVYLEDTETGAFTELTAAPYTLSLATGDFDSRFVLHFATTITGAESVVKTAVNIYSYGEKAYINTNGETAQGVEIYSLNGQLVHSDFNSFAGIRSFEVPATGVYIVKVQTENGVTTERVVIN